MNYALSLLKEIIKKRKLVWDLGKADFRKRFVGSYFGIVWMFIQPVVTIVIYAVIFGIGFKSPPPVPLCDLAGTGYCSMVFLRRSLKRDHGVSSGIQLSGEKGSL